MMGDCFSNLLLRFSQKGLNHAGRSSSAVTAKTWGVIHGSPMIAVPPVSSYSTSGWFISPMTTLCEVSWAWRPESCPWSAVDIPSRSGRPLMMDNKLHERRRGFRVLKLRVPVEENERFVIIFGGRGFSSSPEELSNMKSQKPLSSKLGDQCGMMRILVAHLPHTSDSR